jgi:hypothetical protein
MRIESAVTSVSWIPSEAITGMTKAPFELGVAHYDDPPPDVIHDLGALQAADRFRFANELRAWIDVADGRSARTRSSRATMCASSRRPAAAPERRRRDMCAGGRSSRSSTA